MCGFIEKQQHSQVWRFVLINTWQSVRISMGYRYIGIMEIISIHNDTDAFLVEN